MTAEYAVRIATRLVRACGPEAIDRRTLARNLGCPVTAIRSRTGLSYTQLMAAAMRRAGRCARLRPAERSAQILRVAVQVAREHGYRALTRAAVARAASVSAPLVGRYWPLPALQDAVVQRALERNLPEIIAEAIVAGHPRTQELTSEQRAAALAHLA